MGAVRTWAERALALLALAVGYAVWGWRGLALALTMIVFWLLLQLTRTLRLLRRASGRPLGQVGNAVMLHARLTRGMPLPAVLKLTGSLGRKVAAEPESFAWTDGGGDTVRVELAQGCVSGWTLVRGAAAEAPVSPAGASAEADGDGAR